MDSVANISYLDAPVMCSESGRIVAVVALIVNEMWKILFLERYNDDRTCRSMRTLPWWKIDKRDMIAAKGSDWDYREIAAIRETLEETEILIKWMELTGNFYDGISLVSGKEYRTYVVKVTQYTWRRVSISDEHKSHEWMTPEEYLDHPLAWPITKQIIKDYIDSL